MNPTIRIAEAKDMPQITKIYNHAVRNTTATFDEIEKTVQERMVWFDAHNVDYPIFVAVDGNTVLGYVSLSQWSTKEAYRGTVELSLYVESDARKNGLGNSLLAHILHYAKSGPLLNITSRITSENDVSMRLHEKHGFEFMGVHKQSGIKFGRKLDVHFYQLLLK